jgi:putative ABC transport system permease protein
VHAVPGVVSASLSQNGPVVTSSQISGISVAGYTPREGEQMSSNQETVTERYFSTVGLRLSKGRLFGPEDRVPNSKATIVNEAMVRRFFPDGDPIGKRWSYDRNTAMTSDAFVIVGVVEDAKYRDLPGSVPTMIYHLSGPSEDSLLNDLEVRTSGPPENSIATIRQALAEAEPRLPVYDIMPISARVSRSLAQDSMIAELTSIFGAMALLLACLGLYGTIAYGVNRRVGELGLRLALGAERRQVLWLVMREALVLVVVGAVLGLPLAYAASRSVATMLYGIGPIDPLAYTGAAVLLVAVGLCAALFPAIRAARIDPMTAIART